MATYSASPFTTSLQSNLVVVDDIDNTSTGVDLTGAPGAINVIYIKNGAEERAFLNIYDDASPALGATEPDWVFPVTNGRTYVVGVDIGADFTSALSLIGSLSLGGAAGSSPSDLDVRVIASGGSAD
jgi:hypothetical protein